MTRQKISKDQPSFDLPVIVAVTNHLNKKQGKLLSVDKTFAHNNGDIERLVGVCNQQQIYDVLFRKKLAGRSYGKKDAVGFIAWANTGWEEKSHFVFLVRDDLGVVAGAIDIKSANLAEAEVGYWASADSPGFMTNTILALTGIAKAAGYQKLFTMVVPENDRSIAVMQRASFQLIGQVSDKGKEYLRFDMTL